MAPSPNRPDLQFSERIIFKSDHGFDWNTTGLEVAKQFHGIIQGKTILITGVADGGLGAEAALSIASASPGLLILSARSVSKLEPVKKSILSQYPDVSLHSLSMDLGSMDSIRKAVKEIQATGDVKIDVLINNAGIMAAPYSETADGLESQFGVGHIGHFLFTNLLLKAGEINDGGRIINITSDGHDLGEVRFDDLKFGDGECYDPWEAYGQAKTANILFALGLAKRLAAKNIESYSVHPGVIMNTNLGQHMGDDDLKGLMDKERPFQKTESGEYFKEKMKQQGVSTHLVAAFDPAITLYNGRYLEDCHIYQPRTVQACDEAAAEKLWTTSETLVGEKFTY